MCNGSNDVVLLQGKGKESLPYADYGGWHKAAKVDR